MMRCLEMRLTSGKGGKKIIAANRANNARNKDGQSQILSDV